MNIPEGDEPWREHSMGADGCVKNPRRLQALKKSLSDEKSGDDAKEILKSALVFR